MQTRICYTFHLGDTVAQMVTLQLLFTLILILYENYGTLDVSTLM